MLKLDPNVEHHPAVITQFEKRASDYQLRAADKITAFAGSMNFVYIHAVLFALWMLVFERSPWPTLTLIVSLEAIFLSTFVMIGQNRQAAFQQTKADQDYVAVNKLLVDNTTLTEHVAELTQQIHTLTVELHTRIVDQSAGSASD
jgi:uncharacterized membrane protein